jgi:polyhydroxybutyrate depolymerase
MRKFYVPVLAICLLFVIMCFTSLFARDISLSGEVRKESLEFAGMHRTYLAYIPSGKLSSPALIIALHGSLGTGQKMRQASAFQFDRLADSKKCIVVYPDGYKNHWNDCRTVPTDAAHTMNIDDVGFISALIEACTAKWHIDPARVFAVGLSNGGHMCFRLASEIPGKIAGIVAIGASMPVAGVSKCPAAKAGIPVIIMNGTDDPINPYDGGMVRLLHFYKKGEVLSSLDSARAWLKPESRNAEPVTVQVKDKDPQDGSHVEIKSWPGSPVRLYTIKGGGHTIPGGKQYLPGFIIGKVNRDIDTAEEMWNFFNRAK